MDCVLVPNAHRGRGPCAVNAEKVAESLLLTTAAGDAVVSTVSSLSGSSSLIEWGQKEHGCGVPVLS